MRKIESVVYVTGNVHKARYFNKLLGYEVRHMKCDVNEIQSLDPSQVAEHKARAAYVEIGVPVLVEDTFLVLDALGRLPGPYIKDFFEELGHSGLCSLAARLGSASAKAGAVIAYFDGQQVRVFSSVIPGVIAESPRGGSDYGWNDIFVPDTQELTLGEMSETALSEWTLRMKPFREVADFLSREIF